jgi:hypothetical protein
MRLGCYEAEISGLSREARESRVMIAGVQRVMV